MKHEAYLSKLPSLEGKTIVVTGSNTGIGLQIAKHLAWLRAKVVMACRSEERAQAAMAYIRTQVPEADLEFVPYDQASLAALDRFAAEQADRRFDGFILTRVSTAPPGRPRPATATA